MATPQEQADAAYRAYEDARNAFNQAQSNPAGFDSPSAIGILQSNLASAEAASNAANDALRATYQDTSSGNTGGTGRTDEQIRDEQRRYDERMRDEQRAYERETRQREIIGSLRAAFADYGLGDLFPEIERFARQDLTEGAILLELRKTQAYKNRFPAIEALARKNRVITEGEYIAFERNAAQLERAYGLPAGMLDSRDTVANLLTNEVSARELEERVTLAAAGAIQTSQEMRDTFKRFYGIDSGGLTAYFLDPEKAMPLLNKQFVSSQIGAEATMQDINIGSQLAEQLTESGIDREQARQGFGQVRQMRGLSAGRGDVASQEQLIGATLQGQQDATESVRRAQAARVGRFQQGGGAITSQQGVTGAGSAATR